MVIYWNSPAYTRDYLTIWYERQKTQGKIPLNLHQSSLEAKDSTYNYVLFPNDSTWVKWNYT